MRKCANCGHRYPLSEVRCPECATHGPPQRDAAEAPDPNCAWNAGGERCGYPGTISNDMLGKGPWYCSLHYAMSDALAGADVVRASQSYQPASRTELLAATQREAAAFCAERGLDTVAQRGAWCKERRQLRPPGTAWATRIAERVAAGEPVAMIALEWARQVLEAPQREPGQDDEEREAA